MWCATSNSCATAATRHARSARRQRQADGKPRGRRGCQFQGDRRIAAIEPRGQVKQFGGVLRIPRAGVAGQTGLAAFGVERHARMHELLVRLLAERVRREPVERARQRGAVGRALGQPVAVVAARGERGRHERLQIVGHVVQRVAFGEIERGAVGRDVVADMLDEQTLRRRDHLAVVERERRHRNELDPMALPVVRERALERARLRVHLLDVAVRELVQKQHGRVARFHRQRARGHVVREDQRFEARFVDRIEARLIGRDPRVQKAVDELQEAVVARGAPGERRVAHQVEFLLGLHALVVDALVRQRAFRVQPRERMRHVVHVRLHFGHQRFHAGVRIGAFAGLQGRRRAEVHRRARRLRRAQGREARTHETGRRERARAAARQAALGLRDRRISGQGRSHLPRHARLPGSRLTGV
ncbi:hypothetical protein PT2222_10017 [Paraburkholderia tropica]